MIPICRDPKRFVAALNKERYIRAQLRLSFKHAVPCAQFVSTSFRCHPSIQSTHFSTAPLPSQSEWVVADPAPAITAHEISRADSMNLIGKS